MSTGKKLTHLLTVVIVLGLTACGRESINSSYILQDENNILPGFNSFAAESDEISNFIKANTMATDDWGIKVKQLPVQKQAKKATLLSYLAFDNNKEVDRHELKPVINMHEMAGSSKILNQVLLADGDQNAPTKRYYIINDNNQDIISSPYIQYPNDKDTGDYRTLAAYLKWGFSSYPAKTRIVDINNHGGAYMGIAADNRSGNHITTPDLAKAIGMGAGKLDIINFDACLMSTIEVDYEIRNLVDIIVSSEDKTYRTGMNYVSNLPEILSKSQNNDQFAQNILAYSDRTGQNPNVLTISAVKGGDIDRLVYHLNQLSRMLLNHLSFYKEAIKSGLDATHQLPVDLSEQDGDIGQRDLYEVIARIEIALKEVPQIKNDQEILNAIQNVREDANRAIIRSRNNKTETWAEGMAINISPDSVKTDEYQKTSFAKNTLWDELILAVNE